MNAIVILSVISWDRFSFQLNFYWLIFIKEFSYWLIEVFLNEVTKRKTYSFNIYIFFPSSLVRDFIMKKVYAGG